MLTSLSCHPLMLTSLSCHPLMLTSVGHSMSNQPEIRVTSRILIKLDIFVVPMGLIITHTIF